MTTREEQLEAALHLGVELVEQDDLAGSAGWDSFHATARAARPAPEPLWIAPEVWRVLDKKWQWAAADRNGTIWVYCDKPGAFDWRWRCGQGAICLDDTFATHLVKRGTVPWDQSLIQRPEGE